MKTTIQIEKKILEELKNLRKHPRQTYNELISELINFYKNVSINNQYDEFLHKIQQDKMKEIWDNKEDEAWENV
jgi:mRNA-degrading endonuclease RelE of RelBE toxin-antitoxin system